MGRVLPLVLDDSLHGFVEQVFGRPIGECVDHWPAIWNFTVGQEDEVWQLLADLRKEGYL